MLVFQGGIEREHISNIPAMFPGNILEFSKVNFNTSPLGTPACSIEAESTLYFSPGPAHKPGFVKRSTETAITYS